MKRSAGVLLAVILMVILLCGCQRTTAVQVSCADVIAAYESAGYEVFHKDTAMEEDYVCYVKAEDEKTGDSIYFHFFDAAEEAEAYAEDRKWNVFVWFYTVALSEPTWLKTKTYGNIEYEYDNKALTQPFIELIG